MMTAHLERESLGEDDPDALVFTDDKGGAPRYSNGAAVSGNRPRPPPGVPGRAFATSVG
jgi:hypothetical protein